jgi:hypothetical protein
MGVVPLFQASTNKVMHPVHSFGSASYWCCRPAAGKLPQAQTGVRAPHASHYKLCNWNGSSPDDHLIETGLM